MSAIDELVKAARLVSETVGGHTDHRGTCPAIAGADECWCGLEACESLRDALAALDAERKVEWRLVSGDGVTHGEWDARVGDTYICAYDFGSHGGPAWYINPVKGESEGRAPTLELAKAAAGRAAGIGAGR